MAREWHPIDGDPRWDDEGYYDEVSAQCDALAKWWSQINDTAEKRGWRYRDEADDFFTRLDYPQPRWYDGGINDPEYIAALAECESEIKAYEDQKRATEEMERLQMEFIETRLDALGARMARPYEHWNEDEALMAYLERDR